VGENIAFTVDGRVISAPTIQSAITGDTTITGQFTEEGAERLAARLGG
jgi:preprotein translocase subunit SecD